MHDPMDEWLRDQLSQMHHDVLDTPLPDDLKVLAEMLEQKLATPSEKPEGEFGVVRNLDIKKNESEDE